MGFGATDVGRIREQNEDYFLINPDKLLFIVSDGMGGHNAGEVASLTAAETVNAHFTRKLLSKILSVPNLIREELMRSIKKAHREVREMADQTPAYRGMGCTILVALIDESTLHLGHVGDTRAYVSDDKRLRLLTTDHTYVMQLVQEGKMKMEEIRQSPIKNHLSQALGAPINVMPDYNYYRLNKNEKILLCTDGLWDTLPDREIHKVLKQKKSQEEICRELIDKGNKAGGHDNITVIVVEHKGNGERADDETQGDGKTGEYRVIFSPSEEM